MCFKSLSALYHALCSSCDLSASNDRDHTRATFTLKLNLQILICSGNPTLLTTFSMTVKLLTPDMVFALGPCGTSALAQDILRTGSTASTRHIALPPATVAYLASHRRFSVLALSDTIPIDFRTATYAASWKRMDEFTSSGPSGLHFGHFQANASDPLLAMVDAALARIPTMSGYVPQRWMQGLNVMLEKKPGVAKVTRLRTILLYEADFNHNNKLMGRAMMQFSEWNGLLAPEQYGSRKAHSAIYQCVNKVLAYDIFRQSRHPGALCSNDAKSCYDRIAHGAAGLAMQRCGVPLCCNSCNRHLRNRGTLVRRRV